MVVIRHFTVLYTYIWCFEPHIWYILPFLQSKKKTPLSVSFLKNQYMSFYRITYLVFKNWYSLIPASSSG